MERREGPYSPRKVTEQRLQRITEDEAGVVDAVLAIFTGGKIPPFRKIYQKRPSGDR